MTVAECLALPALQDGTVLAGAGGLARPVRMVHVVDVPGAGNWVDQDVLMLTTGQRLQDSPDEWEVLLGELHRRDVAGLVVGIGMYVQDTAMVPASAIAAADAYNLPLIGLPWAIPFLQVSEEVHRALVAQQVRELDRLGYVQEEMLRLAVAHTTLGGLLSALSRVVGRPLTLTDADGRIQAVSTLGGDGAVVMELPVPEEVLASGGHVRVGGEPGISAGEDRILHYLVLIIALFLLREQVAARTEARLQHTLLSVVLERREVDPITLSHARLLGFDPAQQYRVLLLDPRPSGVPRPNSDDWPLQNLVRVDDLVQSQLGDWRSLSTILDGHVVVLLRDHGARLTPEAVKLKLAPVFRQYPGLVGILTDRTAMEDLWSAVSQAEKVAGLVNPGELLRLEDLVFPRIVAELPGSLMTQYVGLTWDKVQDPILRSTLEALVTHYGRRADAARALGVHRNTLRHRIGQIEQVIQTRLTDDVVTRLTMARMWMRTRDYLGRTQ